MHRTYRFLFLFFWNSFLSPSHPLTYASPAYGLSMGSMPGPSQYHASNMHSDQMPMGFMAADNMENMRKMFKRFGFQLIEGVDVINAILYSDPRANLMKRISILTEAARIQYYELYKLYELEHYQDGHATTIYYVAAVLHFGLQEWLAFDKEHTQLIMSNQIIAYEADIERLNVSIQEHSGKVHEYFAVKQNEKNKEKQFLAEIKLKHDNQVEKYRSYCIGELPKIQIRSSDIIIPLQALSQYENYISHLLYLIQF
ncbi:unnamed protein product [Rotaria magnacalcarata]|uniref:DNA-dependent protein kinase catalytic subunit CC5 domain-containing protein n=2 Tax=Rotaria magnacalcarata TaxID=392030 RepID=A0A8S2JGN9_9BILA|nr:unnamed protein product [Rotaria magnacalcarata]